MSNPQTSQKLRKRIEEIFGWCKEVGGLRRTRKRGADRVGFKFQPAMQFAGGGAVGGRRLGGEELGQERGGFGRPVRVMVAAGTARGPGVGAALGTGPEVSAIKLVEAGAGQAEFGGGGAGVELT